MHNLLHPEQEERRLDAVLPCLLSKPAREEGTDASQGRNLPTAKSLKDQGKPTAGHSTHHTFCLDPSFRAAVDGLSEALSSAPRGCGTVPLTPTPAQSLPKHGEQTHTLSLALSLPAQPFSTHFTKGGKELAVLCAAGLRPGTWKQQGGHHHLPPPAQGARGRMLFEEADNRKQLRADESRRHSKCCSEMLQNKKGGARKAQLLNPCQPASAPEVVEPL